MYIVVLFFITNISSHVEEKICFHVQFQVLMKVHWVALIWMHSMNYYSKHFWTTQKYKTLIKIRYDENTLWMATSPNSKFNLLMK